MVRYYYTCEKYKKGVDMLTFIKHDDSKPRMCSVHDYELRTGKTPVTRYDVNRIISERVMWGLRGYIRDELQNKGITTVFVKSK